MIEKQRQKSGSLTQEDKDKITGQLLRWRATILAAFHCSKCGKTREYREAKQELAALRLSTLWQTPQRIAPSNLRREVTRLEGEDPEAVGNVRV